MRDGSSSGGVAIACAGRRPRESSGVVGLGPSGGIRRTSGATSRGRARGHSAARDVSRVGADRFARDASGRPGRNPEAEAGRRSSSAEGRWRAFVPRSGREIQPARRWGAPGRRKAPGRGKDRKDWPIRSPGKVWATASTPGRQPGWSRGSGAKTSHHRSSTRGLGNERRTGNRGRGPRHRRSPRPSHRPERRWPWPSSPRSRPPPPSAGCLASIGDVGLWRAW